MIFTGTSDGKDGAESHHELCKEAVKQPALTEKRQSSSWLGMNELQLEIQRLTSDIDTRNAYTWSLERDHAKAASVVLENEVLRKKVDELIKNMEIKDAELYTLKNAMASSAETTEEAKHMRAQMEAFAYSNNKLRETIAKHTAQANDVTRLQASVSDLQAKLNAEEDTNKRLTTTLSENTDTIKEITRVSDVLRAQNKSLVSKVNGLQEDLDSTEKARDGHYKNYTQTLQRCNTLQQETAALKEEKRALVEKLNNQLHNLGGWVTDLDLMQEEIRIYVCPHDGLRTIYPATAKITQMKKAWMIASEIWKLCDSENKFLKAYETSRRNILEHHRAHERAQHKNGHCRKRIKAAFEELDQKRQFCTKYN
ncbi:hypothetical protein COCVIDRAFT_34285 [Bipolaris victoriae FI3]|uniref:Uncharacterized protein n=1 Tax=Bipolaris victoriae (strain FI3) TaxID=930091 RepID=W7EVR5_BIPV3|nr:hypothetical protein COCVIDRAFT_34285 [Bipolaris victoriae FI3]